MHKPVEFPGGIVLQWSPVNQAYIVMWYTQVLRVFGSYRDAHDYVMGLIHPSEG